MRKGTIAAAGLAMLASTAPAQDMVKLTPEQVGEIFCISMLGNDTAPIEALLTPDLADAVAQAQARNAEVEAANPGEKPPLGDGIPWQDAPDYAPTCTLGEVTMRGDEAEIPVRHGFPGDPDADFTDRLLLRLVPGTAAEPVWRIDNLLYASESDLRATLVAVFEQ